MRPVFDAGPVLIIDNQVAFYSDLGRSFRDLGICTWVSDDLQQACAICATQKPAIIITELRVDDRLVFDFIGELIEPERIQSVVIATSYPSVPTALQAGRMRFAGYMAKPVTASAIIDIFQMDDAPDSAPRGESPRWPTLDRTIWDYLNQAYLTAGTISETARRLRLDRKSLKRMLARTPPTG